MITAIIPLKDLVQAKSRLSGLLGPSERRALAQAMAEDVLAQLQLHPRVDDVVLVSDDAGARMLAAAYGARCWSERSLGCHGLNAALAAACGRLARERSGQVLIMHADVPLVTGRELDEAIAAQAAAAGIVIGPDRHGIGTNLMLFSLPGVPDFHFGSDSCRRHLAWARTACVPAHTVQLPGIGLDVDEPEDLARLLAAAGSGAGARTFEMLRSSGVADRLRLTLPGLGSRDAQPMPPEVQS
ncbi:MAG: 2-phospho-L-lactate guanylyltransferase [Halioglobus sp.]|nr:2-phospho-L-lactate guanylyltransferase [Halioglobus sp.]